MQKKMKEARVGVVQHRRWQSDWSRPDISVSL